MNLRAVSIIIAVALLAAKTFLYANPDGEHSPHLNKQAALIKDTPIRDMPVREEQNTIQPDIEVEAVEMQDSVNEEDYTIAEAKTSDTTIVKHEQETQDITTDETQQESLPAEDDCSHGSLPARDNSIEKNQATTAIASDRNEMPFRYIAYWGWPLASIVLIMSLYLFRKGKVEMDTEITSNDTGEENAAILLCPQCGWRHPAHEKVCRNPKCNLRF